MIIKDRGIFLDFLCILSDEAGYVRDCIITSIGEKGEFVKKE